MPPVNADAALTVDNYEEEGTFMRVILKCLQSTHQAYERAKPPGLITKNPNTISVNILDHRGHYGFYNRDVDGGRKRSSETIQIAITRGEPIIGVCACERCLYCFE